MSAPKQYLTIDEFGVMHVGQTRVQFEGVVAPFLDGTSAEEIQRMYPSLSLEEVYGAITHYLANQTESDEYLRRRDAEWQAARAEQDRNPSPLVLRLRALMNARADSLR